MAGMVKGIKRTHYCAQLRLADAGREVALFGWAQRQRDLGGLVFIDLRDRTGIVQLSFDDDTQKPVFEAACRVRSEFVLCAVGTVQERSSKNPDLPTGDIEVKVSRLEILGESETPPFEIMENCTTSEAIRMKYRYLDLRRPDLQNNILMRHKIAKVTRDYFDENGFIEIETPILIKSTPEGARDYLVPSRVHPGEFYALPQSPQLYKQLSMVAGFDRYMQLARCFRDEDLRADRQPEFTQIDFEMSFADMEDIIAVAEGFMKRVFREVLEIQLPDTFPRITYDESMRRFGSDKPDTRYGMELFDLSEIVRGCGFGVFQGALEAGGTVCGITAKQAVKTYSRKEIDKLTEFARGIGARGLAWIRMTGDGAASSFAKFMSEAEMTAILQAAGAETGDVVFIIADAKKSLALSVLGALRGEAAKRLGLIDNKTFNPLWVVDIPFFELDEESGEWVAMHHPFTSPKDECLDMLDGDKGKVYAKAWDLVLNGMELSSGSIRITDPALQSKIFDMLGFTKAEAQEKFGYLLDAFRYGAPPHGGMGIGLDRLVMQMLCVPTLRDVTAFPKMQNAGELMTECPAPVDQAQLDELGLKLVPQAEK